MKLYPKKQFLNEEGRSSNDYYLGIFYFNRNDPKIIVPKLNAHFGWTLNMASIYSYLLLAGIILAGILANFLWK